MAAHRPERIGKIDDHELREIREVHQSGCALLDLFLGLAPGDERLYERVVMDMGQVATALVAWWESGARKHRWPGVLGGSWRIDLRNGDVLLCEDEDLLAGCRWPCRRSMSAPAGPDAPRGDVRPRAAAPPEVSVPDDDATIVPGERIGPHSLHAQPAELVGRLGRPDRAFRGPETLPIDPLPTDGVVLYTQRRLSIVIHSSRIEEIATSDPRFRLRGALAVGSRRDAVLALLGPPAAAPTSTHKELLSYPDGVVLEIDPPPGVVRRISVRRAARRGA